MKPFHQQEWAVTWLRRINNLSNAKVQAYIAPFMSTYVRWLGLGLLMAVLTPGCNRVIVDPGEEFPVLSDPQTSYDDRDNRFYAAVTVTLPASGGALDSIWVELYLVSGELVDSLGTDSALAEWPLADSATNGDILPRDDVYARKFDSPLPPATGGSVRIDFRAIVAGDTSQEAATLNLVNLRPVILSAVLTTYTLIQPDSPAVVIDTIYVAADDADGLEDLKSVTFEILKPDGTLGVGLGGSTAFPLFDDGTRIDQQIGDGTFSGGVTFGSQNEVGTYTLMFVAKDLGGAVSDTVTHQVVVQ